MENHADRGRAGAGLIGWGITALLSLALLLYAWWVEPDWIEVKEHDRKHAQVQEPIRVAQLSDLHLNEIGRREHRIAQELERIKPHIVVLTGDVIDQADALPVLDAFLGMLGDSTKLAVLGNWEYWAGVNMTDLRYLYEEKHGVDLLVNQEIIYKVGSRRIRFVGKALWRMLGGTNPTIKVYASGLNPTAPEVLASQSLDEGHRAFKLKVGFGQAVDHANLQALREVIGNCELMVDANQAWDLATACVEAKALAKYNLNWLEEPLRADRPWAEWQELASVSPVVLAAGENLARNEAFLNAFKSRALRVVQPDLAKWGGISSCLPLAHQIRQSGLHYCPHYLGAGVGLLASAHVLAAVGGEGRLEVDANPNPLRSLTCGPLKIITDGFCSLNEDPGLGISVNTANLREFESRH